MVPSPPPAKKPRTETNVRDIPLGTLYRLQDDIKKFHIGQLHIDGTLHDWIARELWDSHRLKFKKSTIEKLTTVLTINILEYF